MRQTQHRPNYLGLRGWVWGGKYGLERYLYLLHRLSGLWLTLFVMMHLLATIIFRIQGQNVWAATVNLFQDPWLKVTAYVAVVALVYHGLNGVRLTLQELGFALGQPTPPLFPYRDALRKARAFMVVLLVAMLVLAFVFFLDFFPWVR
ncbi:MAG: hypothetical protein HYX81_03850 [Chloroflexi bacterium]|nr:hypothetical protein [Chloroflexota bacterium]